jgi:1-acyl-sn-glycerol-3-phosphate acyltransferase
MALVYRRLRVEASGLGTCRKRVLLIGNHAGNTFAWDGAMLGMALFLDGEPPRMLRGMGEYYLPTIPFFSVFMHRVGSVVGTPSNCAHLLGQEEAIMVFPEGERGFVKTRSATSCNASGSASCGWRSRRIRRSCRWGSWGPRNNRRASRTCAVSAVWWARPRFP